MFERSLVQQWNPNIVFLMETKTGVKRMEKVKKKNRSCKWPDCS